MTARQIGERLHIGERTVETHLANLYVKLGVESKRELLQHAAEDPAHGLVEAARHVDVHLPGHPLEGARDRGLDRPNRVDEHRERVAVAQHRPTAGALLQCFEHDLTADLT